MFAIIRPFLAGSTDLEANDSVKISKSYMQSNRDKLPPVLVNKLRKQYPPLGGAPPKVALASLDLHVPVHRNLIGVSYRTPRLTK